MANVGPLTGGQDSCFGVWQGETAELMNPPLEAEVEELDGVTAVTAVPTD